MKPPCTHRTCHRLASGRGREATLCIVGAIERAPAPDLAPTNRGTTPAMTVEAIAAAMGVSLKTVKRLLASAVRKVCRDERARDIWLSK